MSDRLAVMSAGRILQVGSPREIYDHPADHFVADFIGETNFIDAEVLQIEPGVVSLRLPSDKTIQLPLPDGFEPRKQVSLAIRPEHAGLTQDAGEAPLRGTLENIVYFGTGTHYFVRLPSGEAFVVRLANLREDETDFSIGEDLGVDFTPGAIQILRD